MNISELNDEEVLNFLMTSDFEGDYSPVELKYLLVKWKYFYRLSNGSREQYKMMSEGQIERLKDDIKIKTSVISSLEIDNESKDLLIKSMQNRKLTLSERWSGKIINNNGNKEI